MTGLCGTEFAVCHHVVGVMMMVSLQKSVATVGPGETGLVGPEAASNLSVCLLSYSHFRYSVSTIAGYTKGQGLSSPFHLFLPCRRTALHRTLSPPPLSSPHQVRAPSQRPGTHKQPNACPELTDLLLLLLLLELLLLLLRVLLRYRAQH